jgi:hypothetical protein
MLDRKEDGEHDEHDAGDTLPSQRQVPRSSSRGAKSQDEQRRRRQ